MWKPLIALAELEMLGSNVYVLSCVESLHPNKHRKL
jgi:hypothetical protein